MAECVCQRISNRVCIHAHTPTRACHEKWIFFYTRTRGIYLKEKNKPVLFENQIRRRRPLSERLNRPCFHGARFIRPTFRVRWTVFSNTFRNYSKSPRGPAYKRRCYWNGKNFIHILTVVGGFFSDN